MKTETLVKRLLKEKLALVAAVKVSCDSIVFWEKKSDKLFKKMDETEEAEQKEWGYDAEEETELLYQKNFQDIEFLMKRIKFEDDLLDDLEEKIGRLEEEVIKLFATYAQKQKK